MRRGVQTRKFLASRSAQQDDSNTTIDNNNSPKSRTLSPRLSAVSSTALTFGGGGCPLRSPVQWSHTPTIKTIKNMFMEGEATKVQTQRGTLKGYHRYYRRGRSRRVKLVMASASACDKSRDLDSTYRNDRIDELVKLENSH